LHDSKDKLRIFDIVDNTKYSSSHAEYRQEIYDKEDIEWTARTIEINE
jgi:hypothetical protein